MIELREQGTRKVFWYHEDKGARVTKQPLSLEVYVPDEEDSDIELLRAYLLKMRLKET